MNKSVKRIICLLLSTLTAFSFVACDDGSTSSLPDVSESSSSSGSDSGESGTKIHDTENRAVVFATDALDGNFNPFFATSAPDSEMASMTQIGMLTTDKNGNIACGENEPTVVLDYTENEVTEAGKKYTDYSFVIKNGIQFSDGKPLTIKDVLFNLYVYLDPAYMGSATLYSTDIVGLKAYQSQEADADSTNNDMEASFKGEAEDRMGRLLDYLSGETNVLTEEIEKDIETTKKFFRKEVETDWTSSQGQLESFEDEYTFTEDWQVYYYYAGIITEWTGTGAESGYMDTNGKYITNITEPESVQYKVGDQVITYAGDHYNAELVEGITNAVDKKEFATNYVYTANIGEEGFLNKTGMADVLTYWKTGQDVLNDFIADARQAWFDKTGMSVPTISGITTSKTAVGEETHDVLNIRINDVDPKAIYNFAFAVAPMHYYSGEYNDVNYVQESLDELEADVDVYTKFGVKFADKGFFENVLQADHKNKKPVGAGVYKASNQDGDEENVSGNDFFSDNWVYFVRNTNFETVGGDAIYNAKIKYLSYKVVNSDKLLQALKAKDIDIGEPNATAQNITEISNTSHLAQRTVATNGYGYVGVNPKYIPDIEVRQAIMKAMDLSKCIEYYTDANASVLYRSMSKESWIWDKLPQSEYPSMYQPYYQMTRKAKEITDLVEDAGWRKTGSVYAKDGKTLKFTFTIAGATEDHPAFKMFCDARDFLNKNCGFDITVATDISALKKLATGQLEVWAAAWSSTVDPDMYQVYHKDSNATSINNWGYPTIEKGTDKQFGDEKKIIDDLSLLIEQGRETTNQDERAKTYAKALDKVMELAVELPTYQRNDCVCYNKNVIKYSSLNDDPTAFAGVIDRIWELDYN